MPRGFLVRRYSGREDYPLDLSLKSPGPEEAELGPREEETIVHGGDIDPAYNTVEATEEAKAELAKIENRIGDYVCRLCRELYRDPFGLAAHRCSGIVRVEYKCSECDKSFNCPANLASHRRWHKPGGGVSPSAAPRWPCPACPKAFRKQAYLRKHLVTHAPPRLPFVATG